MRKTADQPTEQVPGSPDDGVPPHRYTPALAQQIQLSWHISIWNLQEKVNPTFRTASMAVLTVHNEDSCLAS